MRINGRVLRCLEKRLEQRTKYYALTLVLQSVMLKNEQIYVNHYISQFFSIHMSLINFCEYQNRIMIQLYSAMRKYPQNDF